MVNADNWVAPGRGLSQPPVLLVPPLARSLRSQGSELVRAATLGGIDIAHLAMLARRAVAGAARSSGLFLMMLGEASSLAAMSFAHLARLIITLRRYAPRPLRRARSYAP